MSKKTNKGIFKIILFLGSAISLYFVPWIVLWAWILPLPDSIQNQLNEAVDHGLDGIVVYVDRVGNPPQFYAAGVHNRKDKIPAKPKAIFKIASISKLYTAVAVTKLVHEGRLSLTAPITDYLPELKGKIENAEHISLQLLVQHRSGIPNYTNAPNYWLNPPATNAEKLKLVLNLPANFKPNEDYEYSNTNYLLLGQIMDKVLSYEHFKYIQNEILNPLNLEHTYASLADVNIDKVMSGYHVGYEEDLKYDNIGMLATAEDVGIFLRALNDGTLLNEKEQEIYASIYVYEHTGLIPGYQSIAKYHKELDAVVIQFTSTTNFKGYNWNTSEVIYSRIIKILEQE